MNCLSKRRMKKQPIPIAAPVIGVTGSNWAERWLTVRRGLGLNATLDRALMRDPTPSGGWRRACMFPTEVANWVVYSLKFYGVPVEELNNVGAHSLKATLNLLDYHIDPKKGTHREYTRHELSPALRWETLRIRGVREGKYCPDQKREVERFPMGLAALGLSEMGTRPVGGSTGPPLAPAEPAAQAPAEPPAQVPEASSGVSFEQARPFDYEPEPAEQAGDDDEDEEDRLGLLEACSQAIAAAHTSSVADPGASDDESIQSVPPVRPTAQIPDSEQEEFDRDEITEELETAALLSDIAAETAAKPQLALPATGLYQHEPEVPGRCLSWKSHRGHAIRPCETHCGKQLRDFLSAVIYRQLDEWPSWAPVCSICLLAEHALFRAGVLWPSEVNGLPSGSSVAC